MIWILRNFSSSSMCCCRTISICPRILAGQLLAAHLDGAGVGYGGECHTEIMGCAGQGEGENGGSRRQLEQPGLGNREVEVSLEAATATTEVWGCLAGKAVPALGLWAASREMHTQCAQCSDRTRREWCPK